MSEIYQRIAVPAELEVRLRSMPKVEIHVHLEGATDAKTIWEMAKRNGISLPVDSLEEWQAFYEFRDFPHFATVYVTAISSMRTPEDYSAMVVSFLENQAAQNIRYSEAYFSPQHHLGRNLSSSEILDALEEGANVGMKKYGSSVRFIADVSRELPSGEADVLSFAVAGLEKGGLFVALGIGGIEVGNPAERFTGVFARARDAGLRVVAHAGETDGPESVWGAIRHLKAERIGHGVRSLDDEVLVDYLRKTQLPLEVSPNSNYRLKVVPMDQPHPIRGLVDARLFVTLSSDDPPMFSTDLNNEYLTLAGQGFTWEELWKLNVSTLEASFLPESEKSALRAEWETFAVKQV